MGLVHNLLAVPLSRTLPPLLTNSETLAAVETLPQPERLVAALLKIALTRAYVIASSHKPMTPDGLRLFDSVFQLYVAVWRKEEEEENERKRKESELFKYRTKTHTMDTQEQVTISLSVSLSLSPLSVRSLPFPDL